MVTGAAKGIVSGAASAGRRHGSLTPPATGARHRSRTKARSGTRRRAGSQRQDAGGRVLDVRDRAAFERALQAPRRWGPVHVLVNNAGRSKVESLMDITPESFSAVVATNVDGVFLGCQVFGAYFAAHGTGASSTSPRSPDRTAAPPPGRTTRRPRAESAP